MFKVYCNIFYFFSAKTFKKRKNISQCSKTKKNTIVLRKL